MLRDGIWWNEAMHTYVASLWFIDAPTTTPSTSNTDNEYSCDPRRRWEEGSERERKISSRCSALLTMQIRIDDNRVPSASTHTDPLPECALAASQDCTLGPPRAWIDRPHGFRARIRLRLMRGEREGEEFRCNRLNFTNFVKNVHWRKIFVSLNMFNNIFIYISDFQTLFLINILPILFICVLNICLHIWHVLLSRRTRDST